MALFFVGFTTLNAQLKDGLIAYWPLDEVQGSKTPELVNGYDMELYDWCQVMVLDEDGEYLVNNPIWLRGGEAKQWRLEKGKIPAGALGQKIRLEFSFSSDGGQDNGPQSGWFIEDIAITTK